MLERTDYTIKANDKASVNTPIEFVINVPTNRTTNDVDTVFQFTDGAGGTFEPDRIVLPNGQGELKFNYTPRKPGNLVVSISSSEDLHTPRQHTVTVTVMQVRGTVRRGKLYGVTIYNPQALYSHSDQPYTDDRGTIQGQHIVDNHTVELHGENVTDDSITFTDTLTPGSHSVQLSVMDDPTDTAADADVAAHSMHNLHVDPLYDPGNNERAGDFKPRVKPDDAAVGVKTTPETMPVNEIDLVRSGQSSEIEPDHEPEETVSGG